MSKEEYPNRRCLRPRELGWRDFARAHSSRNLAISCNILLILEKLTFETCDTVNAKHTTSEPQTHPPGHAADLDIKSIPYDRCIQGVMPSAIRSWNAARITKTLQIWLMSYFLSSPKQTMQRGTLAMERVRFEFLQWPCSGEEAKGDNLWKSRFAMSWSC